MRIYKYSMGFRTPAADQSYWSIYLNHDLSEGEQAFTTEFQNKSFRAHASYPSLTSQERVDAAR